MAEQSDKEPCQGVVHYFVDEAGDPTIFSRKGRILVGTEGCSSFFIMGKLEVADPDELGRELNALRTELLRDPYFKDVPSMQVAAKKTALAFHANNDLPEVRREVFQVLLRQQVRFYAVVRDKRELLSYVKQRNETDTAYRYHENVDLYDVLVTELLSKFRGSPKQIGILFSKRGKRDRTKALRGALEDAEAVFETRFGYRRKADISIKAASPRESFGLQAVDYYLWALQRFYERSEDRFVQLIWPQVGEVNDLDMIQGHRRGALFHGDKKLTTETRPLP